MEGKKDTSTLMNKQTNKNRTKQERAILCEETVENGGIELFVDQVALMVVDVGVRFIEIGLLLLMAGIESNLFGSVDDSANTQTKRTWFD